MKLLLKSLILSIIALFGINATAQTEDIIAKPLYDGFTLNTPMYTAEQIDQLFARKTFNPNTENVCLGTNSYGNSVVIYSTSDNYKHGWEQCGNVTLGSNATNMNICSVVIGKEAVARDYRSVTIGYRTRNDDSHSTAIGTSQIISTCTNYPTLWCAYQQPNGEWFPDKFLPAHGFNNTAINSNIKDSITCVGIGTVVGWHATTPNGAIKSNQSVVIGKIAKAVNSDDSVAIGTYSTVTNGNRAVAIGAGANASGFGAVAIGSGISATGNQIVIGNSSAESIIIGGEDFKALLNKVAELERLVYELREQNASLFSAARGK